MLTNEEKLECIKIIYERALIHFGSFDEEGCSLTYLMGAIATNTKYDLYNSDPIYFFLKQFKDHPIMQFITVYDEWMENN